MSANLSAAEAAPAAESGGAANPFADIFANAGAAAAEALAAAAAPVMSFDAAKALTSAGEYDDAIDAWAQLLEEAVGAHGETGAQTAPLYYRYGDALLRKAEESDQIFGGGEEDAGGDDVVVEEAAAPAPAANSLASSLAPPEADGERGEKPDSEDVEIAFEVLEVARTIFATASDRESRESLADCWLRLGDVNKLNGRFEAAVADYRACVDLRVELYGAGGRPVADVHWCLAFALECRAADKDCGDARAAKDEAIVHYERCLVALTAVSSTETDAAKRADLASILQELAETVAEAKRLRAEELAKKAAGAAAAPPPSTTTVGFAGVSAGAAAAPVATLVPKRKKAKVAADPLANAN